MIRGEHDEIGLNKFKFRFSLAMSFAGLTYNAVCPS